LPRLLWTCCFVHSNNHGRSRNCFTLQLRRDQTGEPNPVYVEPGSRAGGCVLRPTRGQPLEPYRNLQSRAPDPTTSFLTATTLVNAIGAGITAAAGTRLALQWVLIGCFGYRSLQSSAVIVRPMLLFLVTASTTCCYWAICVPAAILRSGRRFSGALSGVEP